MPHNLLIEKVGAAPMHISHRNQMYLDIRTKTSIVQLDFRAVFERASHIGLLSKMISIRVGSSVLSICKEFLSNRMRVSWLRVLPVSGSESFLACHREMNGSSFVHHLYQ